MFARETSEVTAKTRVVAQCRDADFERLLRSTFGMDAKVELTVAAGAFAETVRKLDIDRRDGRDRRHRSGERGRPHRAQCADPAARRHAAGDRRDPVLRRLGRAATAADAGRGFRRQTGARRSISCAPARAPRRRAKNGADTTEAQIYTFLPAAGGVGLTTLAIETAMLLLKGENGQPDQDLPGRPRFPARLVLRLSRPRTAPRPRRDRAASGPPRPATARGDDVRALVRPEGDRGAEPAGRDAHVRLRGGDAAARSGGGAFRQRRDRRAAHLVRLDR